jgi:hypothetical protein
MSPPPQDHYTRLDTARAEIRVLEILEPSDPDTVACKLHTVSLHDEPAFVALSYVWGDAAVTEEICLDGRRVPVTTNLAQALLHAKKHWRQLCPDRDAAGFRIWADAVCINQADVVERGEQVQIMGSIYSISEMTFAWLGSEDEEIPLAFESIEMIWSVDKSTSAGDGEKEELDWIAAFPSLCREDFPASKFYELDLPIIAQSKAWSALKTLCNLPYWSRIWILQELVLSARLYFICPSSHIDGEKLFDAATYLETFHRSVRNRFMSRPEHMSKAAWGAISTEAIGWTRAHNVSRLREHLRSNGIRSLQPPRDPTVAYEIAVLADSLGCSNPKDKFYGLLAMTRLRLTPDYSASKSLGEVSADFVRAWLLCSSLAAPRAYPPLLFLMHAGLDQEFLGLPNDFPGNFPSWAPRFQYGYITSPFDLVDGRDFRASKDIFRKSFGFPICFGDTLRVQGLLFQLVTYVHDLPEDAADSPRSPEMKFSLLRYMIHFLGRATPSPVDLPPLVTFIRVFLRNAGTMSILDLDRAFEFLLVLVRSRIPHDEDWVEALTAEELMTMATEVLPGARPEQRFSDWLMENMWPDGREFSAAERKYFLNLEQGGISYEGRLIQDMGKIFPYFTFFETEDGFLGLGPRASQAGDVVAVLAGSNVPAILRPVDDDETDTKYRHVGSCFIQGLMTGEAKQFIDAGLATVESLVLV